MPNPLRRCAALAFLLVIVVLGPACGGDEPSGFEPGSAGFEVNVPDSWEEASKDQLGAAAAAAASGGAGDVEAEGLWYLGTTGGFGDNVNVISLAAPPVSTSEYFDLERDQLEAASGRLEPGFELESLDGEPVATYRYTGLGAQTDLEFASVSAIRDDTVYTATLTAGSEQSLEELLPEFESVIHSWSWTE